MRQPSATGFGRSSATHRDRRVSIGCATMTIVRTSLRPTLLSTLLRFENLPAPATPTLLGVATAVEPRSLVRRPAVHAPLDRSHCTMPWRHFIDQALAVPPSVLRAGLLPSVAIAAAHRPPLPGPLPPLVALCGSGSSVPRPGNLRDKHYETTKETTTQRTRFRPLLRSCGMLPLIPRRPPWAAFCFLPLVVLRL